jgi:hypothetical protein
MYNSNYHTTKYNIDSLYKNEIMLDCGLIVLYTGYFTTITLTPCHIIHTIALIIINTLHLYILINIYIKTNIYT